MLWRGRVVEVFTDVEVVEGGFAWGGHCGGEGCVEEEEAVGAGDEYALGGWYFNW